MAGGLQLNSCTGGLTELISVVLGFCVQDWLVFWEQLEQLIDSGCIVSTRL